KYDGLGIDWVFRKTKLVDEAEAQRLAAVAGASGVDPDIVHLTGPMGRAHPYESADEKPPVVVFKGEACG
ncbi:MAG TPA: hypothetical protein VMU10_10895, partial [Desulfomonilia bacterium]|nr:hypothetical protein [Desulfomonilia bacterium]